MDKETTGMFRLIKENEHFIVFDVRAEHCHGSLYFERGKGLVPQRLILERINNTDKAEEKSTLVIA
jgi:hypothetical protein